MNNLKYYEHNTSNIHSEHCDEIMFRYCGIIGETVNYFCPSEFFEEYFRVIKQMVPGCEYTPVVLLTDEDFEDEEE